MEIKSKIVLSKHWHKPEITVSFHVAGVEDKSYITVDMVTEDFSAALGAELGQLPLWRRLLGAKQIDTPAIHAATTAVIEKMKLATVGVVP